MRRLLIVVDPLGGSASVQLELLLSISKGLEHEYSLAAYTPHCARSMRRLLSDAGIQVYVPEYRNFALNRILERFGRSNESMLWAEGWLRDSIFHWNEMDAERRLRFESFDRVINMSSTVRFPADVWWVQGLPLDETLRGMANSNPLAAMAHVGAGYLVNWLDTRLLSRIKAVSRRVIVNSPFVRELYEARGINVDGVVYSVKDFKAFHPSTAHPTRDYVLLYVGKETEQLDFRTLRQAGVRVVGFGCKIPTATRMRGFTDWIEFRGFVSDQELASLYANAMFTLFPFTVEALGYVPIESMACGTPVLTYGRQGPGATVVDGVTGWFVKSADEMLAKALEIWRGGTRGITSDDCIERAKLFSVHRSVSGLLGWIEGTTGH